ncbi:MAG TPA: hypothetical protein VF746_24365 [Longimicrobium sp.]|jgi:hypothetical protein
MRKVRLVLEDLSVESFDTTPGAARGRGTVHGRADYYAVPAEPYSQYPGQCDTYPNCPSPLCVDTPLASCDDASCRWTCGDSCNGTCASCQSCDSCRDTCDYTCGACIPPEPYPA